MNDLPMSDRRHRSPHLARWGGRWTVAAGVLFLAATGCLVVALFDRDGSAEPAAIPFTPATSAVTPPRPVIPPTPRPAVRPLVARSEPVQLRIPTIDLAVSVSTLGLNPDRTVQVPADAGRPGWFRLGPSPGQLGSAVILGHVDSKRGPAVFFRLRSLRPGDRVEVSLANGAVAQFVVNKVATYPNSRFPARQVYGSRGHSALQLVTCGGEYDKRTGYQANVVVYTALAASTPPN